MTKLLKRMLCITLVVVMAASTFVVMAANFSDIDEAHWAHGDVEQLAEMGIIDGYPDGTFKPSNQVTRYEYAKLLCAAMGFEESRPETKIFEDVSKNHWAYGYANAVEPYMTYYRGGATIEYRGDVAADREDIAASLVRALGWGDEPIAEATYQQFSDYEDITEDLRKYVLIAYEKGLVSGYPDGTFGPGKAVTRAETAALLTRAMGDRIVKPEATTPIPSGPPNPILEAIVEESRGQLTALQNETITLEVRAAGSAMVMICALNYDVVDEELLKSILEAEQKKNDDVMYALLDAFVGAGVQDAEVIVIYSDKNGKEIYSKIYKK